jgi:hypothetical protein
MEMWVYERGRHQAAGCVHDLTAFGGRGSGINGNNQAVIDRDVDQRPAPTQQPGIPQNDVDGHAYPAWGANMIIDVAIQARCSFIQFVSPARRFDAVEG